MFLSILIPTYNYTCYKLVYDLQHRLQASRIDYEIIVADDGSRDQVSVIANLKINELPHCQYLRRTQNVGRAAIRNFLIREAHGDWVLFLDSDASIENKQYILAYKMAIKEHPSFDVIAGGLLHPDHCPSPLVSLRFKYEKEADKLRCADIRNQNPYNKFSVFNVLFKRSVFELCRFDEACQEYGHEDTLLGLELKTKKVPIVHIDNPVIHVGLETNEVFLRKTNTAIQTLKQLGPKLGTNPRLAQTAQKLKNWHIAWLYKSCYRLFARSIKHNLLSPYPSLRLFALYKLGQYLK